MLGELARSRGAELPDRMISSAKSWLCHGAVDRHAEILPWGAEADVPSISPVLAQTFILEHLRDAWNEQMAEGDKDLRLESQSVLITVPASFDAVARELTVDAARQAGIKECCSFSNHQICGFTFSVTSSNWELNSLVLPNGSPEHIAVTGVVRRLFNEPSCITNTFC